LLWASTRAAAATPRPSPSATSSEDEIGYNLPPGEYGLEGSFTRSQVLVMAKRASLLTLRDR
jgi:hypothetical protein